MAAIGYGYGLEEISQAQMLGINLTGDDAAAARRAYEEFVDRVALAGDASKGFSGLFNYPGVTAGSAVTGNWETATADQILADVNTALTLQTQGTLFTAFSDTLLLPYAKFLLIATRKVNEQGLETILTYLQKNNVYTATTGRPLTIRGLNGLDAAGAGDTARMVSYRRDPSVLKMHIPMPHRFLPVYQAGPIRWEVPGIFRLGGVDTSDSNLRWLSNGEFVVNAEATRRNRSLLEAINSNDRIPSGSAASSSSSGATASAGLAPEVNIFNAPPGTQANVRMENAQWVLDVVCGSMEGDGQVHQVMAGKYGVTTVGR